MSQVVFAGTGSAMALPLVDVDGVAAPGGEQGGHQRRRPAGVHPGEDLLDAARERLHLHRRVPLRLVEEGGGPLGAGLLDRLRHVAEAGRVLDAEVVGAVTLEETVVPGVAPRQVEPAAGVPGVTAPLLGVELEVAPAAA